MTNVDTFDTPLAVQIAALDIAENEAWAKWQATRDSKMFDDVYRVVEERRMLLDKQLKAEHPQEWIAQASDYDLRDDASHIRNLMRYTSLDDADVQVLIHRLSIARNVSSVEIIADITAWHTSLAARRDAIYVETDRRKS